MNRVVVPAVIAVGIAALFVYWIYTTNRPEADSETERLVYLYDSDLDGIPDDVEQQRGYYVGQKDLTLKYFVQNPDKYKEVVDSALSQTAADYREKNPLNINIHLVYGGEVPYDATYDNGGIAKFYNSNLPMNESENKYSVLGYFLERKGTDRDESGAASGIGVPEFHVFVDGHADFSMSATTKHELGHTMGIDHSHAPFSVMNDKIPRSEQRDFLENEWSILKNERLYDFRCFGVPLGECRNLVYVNEDAGDPDLDNLNLAQEKALGTNPYAIDIPVTCFVQDVDEHPNMLMALEGAKADLKNKVNFVNLDGSRGINLHLPESCENILSDQYNFKGAYDKPISNPVLNDEALMRTSLGKYMKAIAEPEESRTHLQIVFADFEGSGFEKSYGAFTSPLDRQVVVDLGPGGLATKIATNHEIGRLIGLYTSERPDSIMANSPGSTYYDDEWVSTLEEKRDNKELLFRW